MPEKQAKNIIIFSTAYAPLWGGAEVAINEIASRIEDANFFMFTARMRRSLAKTEKVGNILVYRLGLGCFLDKLFLPVLGFFKFFRLVSDFEFGIPNLTMWGMMASYGSIAAYFVKLAKPAIPFLLTLQEGDSESHLTKGKFGLIGFFGKRIIKKADKIQVISNYLKEFALKRGANAPIEIVPNGVDLAKIQNPAPSGPASQAQRGERGSSRLMAGRQNLKLKLNIKPDEKVIITTSRLVKKNAVDIIIDAFSILNSKLEIRNSKLLILGDGPEKENLKFKIKNLKLENDVFLFGFVSPEKIYDYLALADVFVRPSRSEGLGSSFLEAMAMEVPVIGTPVGGIPDFLIEQKTGLFCKVDDPEDLAGKIKLLLEDENLRCFLTANARQLIEEKYDWNIISRKMKEIFEHL